jgi:HCaRG protein.
VSEYLEVTINKSANKLIFKDPETGKLVRIRAKVTDIEDEEDEDEEEEIKLLTPDEFRTALQKVDALGLTWTADRIPGLRAKEGISDEVLLSDELNQIQAAYPYLPREIGALVFHILTGADLSEDLYGSKDDLEKKASVVHELILSNTYRSDFFFKHAIKVPYLTDIDWEVVFKVRERNIKVVPGIIYALLSLEFHNPNVTLRASHRHETFTVAVNAPLVNSLIDTLTELKSQLEASQKAVKIVNKQSLIKGENDADSKNE